MAKFSPPIWVYLYRTNDAFPIFVQLVKYNALSKTYTLINDINHKQFTNKLLATDIINPNERIYNHVTKCPDLPWLKANLYNTLSEIHHIEHTDNNNRFQTLDEKQRYLFRKKTHASMLFENINSHTNKRMSTQSRTFNCAILCAMNDCVEMYSLHDNTLFLQGKQNNHKVESTVKKYCFATYALRIATGLQYKLSTDRPNIKHLQMSHDPRYQYAKNFLDFFSDGFHDKYTTAFKAIRHDIESFDIYKTKYNLANKNKRPIYNDENRTTDDNDGMHYKHYYLLDTLSQKFQQNFIGNAHNVLGKPVPANAYSTTSRFPKISEQEQQQMNNRKNQLWNIFNTNW